MRSRLLRERLDLELVALDAANEAVPLVFGEGKDRSVQLSLVSRTPMRPSA